METSTAKRLAIGATFATAILLMWVIGAVGLIGAEGNPADRMYAGVIAIAAVGALITRLRPAGMTRVLAGNRVRSGAGRRDCAIPWRAPRRSHLYTQRSCCPTGSSWRYGSQRRGCSGPQRGSAVPQRPESARSGLSRPVVA